MEYTSQFQSESDGYSNFSLVVIAIITFLIYRCFFRTKEVRRVMVCLEDYEQYAREKLPMDLYSNQTRGSRYGRSKDDIYKEFDRIQLIPRVLCSVLHVDLHSQALERYIDAPIGIAPLMSCDLMWPNGDVCVARAAAKMNVVNIIPMFGSASIEQIAKTAPSGVKWLQIDILEEDGHLSMVTRAEEAGYEAIVVAVDKFPGIHKQILDSGSGPRCGSFREQQYADVAKLQRHCNSWRDIDNVVSATNLPVVIQGILNPDDAIEAINHGIKGIIVSNSYGSSNDGFSSPIEMLPAVKAAVGNSVEVYLCNDVRNGSDVLKALAYGAKCVFIARPVLYGLSYQGQEGVEQVFDILHEELRTAMFRTGCSTISRISPSTIVNRT